MKFTFSLENGEKSKTKPRRKEVFFSREYFSWHLSVVPLMHEVALFVVHINREMKMASFDRDAFYLIFRFDR